MGSAYLPGTAHAAAATASLAFGPATAIYSLGMIAEAKGFFKAENLDFKLVIGNAGTHGRQALAAWQEVQDHHGNTDGRVDLEHRGAQGPLRRRHHHGREARRL
jgi:NitT/TauT family transport system substrate-binding protein